MTPEEHAKLDRALALAEENNALLLSLKRSAKMTLGLRISYWAVIIALSLGASYFFKSYLAALTGGSFGDAGSANAASQDGNASDTAQLLKDLMK